MSDYIGDSNPNSFSGDSSAESISGAGGNDTLRGNDGNDTISGDDGNDQLFGGLGNDSLSGGEGDDTLTDYLGANALDGGAGNDRFEYVSYNEGSASGADTITTGDGRDVLSLHAYGARYYPLSHVADVVTDFTTGPNGDVISLNNVTNQLIGWDGTTNPFLTGHLFAE